MPMFTCSQTSSHSTVTLRCWRLNPLFNPPRFRVFLGRNLSEVRLLLDSCYISTDYHTEASLLEELSTSLYTYITRGEYPMWYTDRQDLVEYGFARFMNEGPAPTSELATTPPVIVEEPMALMGILRYFETESFTLDKDIRARMQSAKGALADLPCVCMIGALSKEKATVSLGQ